MRAMLLAAGLGTRLKPLSERTPKPLLPVANVPLIEYNLRLLKEHGITEAVINLHHLGGAIEDHLGNGSDYGMAITYSTEEEILGTGGGVKCVEQRLGPGTFVVINADIICDADLTAAIRAHRERRALATMVVLEDPRAEEFGAVEFDERGNIIQIAGKIDNPPALPGPFAKALFTGIHILEPRVLEYIPPDIFVCINNYAYPKMIANREAVFAWPMEGYWCDLGTPQRLLEVNQEMLSRKIGLGHYDPLTEAEFRPRKEEGEAIFLGRDADLGDAVVFEPPVLIGPGCKIRDRAVLGPGAILGAGCQIGVGARITRSVLLPGTKVPEDAELEGVIADREDTLAVSAD